MSQNTKHIEGNSHYARKRRVWRRQAMQNPLKGISEADVQSWKDAPPVPSTSPFLTLVAKNAK